MKKYFIVADVHGYYQILMDALNTAGFDKDNSNHIFVSLGDLMDRGPQPGDCLKFVMSLPADRRILIRGNHEDLMEQAVARREFLSHDWSNGTTATAYNLCYYNSGKPSVLPTDPQVFNFMQKFVLYNDYIASTVDYTEVGDAIFVHGWIPCHVYNSNTSQSKNQEYTMLDNWQRGNWKQARWINGMEAWSNGINLPGKTIYCGHWHTSWGHHYIHGDSLEFPNKRSTDPSHRVANFNPFIDAGIVALDACTAYSHKINCYTFAI